MNNVTSNDPSKPKHRVRWPTIAVATAALWASAAANAAFTFTDITATSGLPTGSVIEGAGWGDYDGDGCIDLLLARASGTGLFKNNCAGVFTDVTASAGISDTFMGWTAVWADYDGDGDLDAYVASHQGANALYQNNGNGTFTDVASAAGVAGNQGSAGASFADYDADGDLDLFVANRFDEVGPDLTDRLYRNEGNGTFTEVGAAAGVAGPSTRMSFMGAWFDYDNDGRIDLYLSVDFGNDVLYKNNGDGTFSDVSAAAGIADPQHGMGVAIGDVNNDGCLDVVSSNNTQGDPSDVEHGPSVLYLNNCNGTFTNVAAAAGILDRAVVEWGANFVDVDYDADLDLSIVAGGMLSNGEPNVLYENDGQGFVDVTTQSGVADSGAAFGSAWADIDNDGDLDWFVANARLTSKLFRNDTVTGNHLKIVLNGAAQNTHGVGARIDLISGFQKQARVIQAGLSYASAEEQAAFFGLGSRTQADKITVHWPSGKVTELENVAANQTVEVTEDDQVPVTTGTFTGVTLNPSGLPEPGVTVLVKDAAGVLTAYLSDAAGNYTIVLPAGAYGLRAVKTGFKGRAPIQFTLAAGETKVVNLRLDPL